MPSDALNTNAEDLEDKELAEVIAELETKTEKEYLELLNILIGLRRDHFRRDKLAEAMHRKSVNFRYFGTLEPEKIRQVLPSLHKLSNPNTESIDIIETAKGITDFLQKNG